MTFTVPADHPALPGHFPGRPVVPGVVVLDHVLAAIEEAHTADHAPLGPLRLPQVKFVRPLLPGETARIELETLAPTADGAPRWRFRVLCGDAPVATGEVQA